MALNGSPPPRYDFDEARSYFRVTLPAHPGFQAMTGK
jgi:ATP-dependent DNA helicase RecG